MNLIIMRVAREAAQPPLWIRIRDTGNSRTLTWSGKEPDLPPLNVGHCTYLKFDRGSNGRLTLVRVYEA